MAQIMLVGASGQKVSEQRRIELTIKLKLRRKFESTGVREDCMSGPRP